MFRPGKVDHGAKICVLFVFIYQVSPSCLSLQGKALHILGNQLKGGRSTQEQEVPGLCMRTIFDQHFVGLMGAAFLGYCERNPAEVEGLMALLEFSYKFRIGSRDSALRYGARR